MARSPTLGAQVDPERSIVAVDGRVIGGASTQAYLLLHKPAGVTSTTRDRHADRTVLDLLPTALVPEGARLYPVGRLDQDSEGMLLLTNDGAWSERVLHPRFGVEREYALGLRQPLDAAQVDALQAGIELDEGLAELSGLRAMSTFETDRLVALMRPTPPAAALVPRDARPGLEAPAATDVRGGRRADRAPRARPDRPGPHRRPAQWRACDR